MSSSFSQCLAFTLQYEGGRADNPRDPGGRTNRGITQRTFAAWLAKQGQPVRDVFTLTPAERDAIYKGDYWDSIGGDALGAGVDLAVFDFAVNSGPARALKAYRAAAGSDGAKIVKSICTQRLSFLRALSTFATFGRGWAARVAACEALGVKMAEHVRIGLAADAAVAPQVASTLQAEGRAAARRSARSAKLGGAVAATGAATHPAVAAGTSIPWPLIALSALAMTALAAALLWRAYRSRLQAEAYSALAKA